jgi:hypothetical protein
MVVKDYLASLVRTVVPVLVGLVLAKVSIDKFGVDGETLKTVVTTVAVGGYYAAVRALEVKWPKVGVLLGWAATPSYEKPAA